MSITLLSDTATVEWVLHLTLTLENPGVSPGSADQCTLGNMFQDPTIQDMPGCLNGELSLCESTSDF